MFVAALAGLLLSGHDSLQPSTDSDHRLPLWGALVPAAVGLLLIRLVPPRAPRLDVQVSDRSRLVRETALVVAIAVLLPLGLFVAVVAGVPTGAVQGVWALGKPVIFLLLPALVLRRWGVQVTPRIESSWWPRQWWRWLAPVPALVAFAWLGRIGPFAGQLPRPEDYPDAIALVVGATVTVFTANICEEVFYRVMVQTRLEALLGRWPAIMLSALLFAWLHLPTHGQGSDALGGLPLTLAVIVAFQGVYGLFAGYMWARYRNVWALVAAHSVINTLPLLLMHHWHRILLW